MRRILLIALLIFSILLGSVLTALSFYFIVWHQQIEYTPFFFFSPLMAFLSSLLLNDELDNAGNDVGREIKEDTLDLKPLNKIKVYPTTKNRENEDN